MRIRSTRVRTVDDSPIVVSNGRRSDAVVNIPRLSERIGIRTTSAGAPVPAEEEIDGADVRERLARGLSKRYPGEMAKDVANTRSLPIGRVLTVSGNGAARPRTVTFGSVIVSGEQPSADDSRINVERSTQALERVTQALTKPGVVLRARKGVPQFSVAEGETDVFIRRLDGKVERGRLVDGLFQVID